ncbi:MAG: hypothetical protein CMB37_00070, partial [Euryarchaeota archaeon]|nr:hypothetical protein [Euryarchaeota archaeon]
PEPEPEPESEVSIASAFEMPLTKPEIREAFDDMDSNSDGVISKEEFSKSPVISKLPDQIQNQMFERMDLNKDELIQYDEFTAAAEVKSNAPFLAPKRAPVAKPVRAPIQPKNQNPMSPSPSPSTPVQVSAKSGGRHRSGVPGVRHVLQTGIYCGGCNIGVEHHWRICPVCANTL